MIDLFLVQTTLNRDPSDETDLDRNGSTGQQLQTVGTDDAPTNVGASTFSIKLKSKRLICLNRLND